MLTIVATPAATRSAAEAHIRSFGAVTSSLTATRPYGAGKIMFLISVVHTGKLDSLPAEVLSDYYPDVKTPDGSKLSVPAETPIYFC